MSAALDFCPANALGPSPSREEELEAIIRRQAIIIEQIELGEPRTPATATKQSTTALPAEEKQALVQILSDLGAKVQALEQKAAQQALQIEDLQEEVKATGQEVYDVHDMAKTIISDACKRITALEDGPSLKTGPAVDRHISELYDHMKAIGRKQVSFREASRCLKLSKSRTLQLKAALAIDERFIIVRSESHRQKELIRLREFYSPC